MREGDKRGWGDREKQTESQTNRQTDRDRDKEGVNESDK